MAGPLFLVFASVRGGSDVSTAWRIAKSGAENNIGLIFGDYIVRCILKDYPGFVEDMHARIDRPLVFLVTSNPLENDAMDLFEEQLNPNNGADPAGSSLLKFFREIWSIDDIQGALIAIWDFISPSYESMPKHEMRFDEFHAWVRNWYGWEDKSRRETSAEGIFRIIR